MMRFLKVTTVLVSCLFFTGGAFCGLFSNDGISTKAIRCDVRYSEGYRLLLAKLKITIQYGHDDVDLFHHVEALSWDDSQTIDLAVALSKEGASVDIPSLDIPLPSKCSQPGYENDELRHVSFDLQLYFSNPSGDYEMVHVLCPGSNDGKKQLKFARSKKLTARLSKAFSGIVADFAANTFSIPPSSDGMIFPDVVNDGGILAELGKIEKARLLFGED